MTESVSRNIWVLCLIGLVLAAVPALGAGESTVYFLCLVLIWGLFAAAFDLVFGLTGILSFGHAALFGTGAYVFSVLTSEHGIPWAVGLLAGGIVAGLLGVVYGLITRRVGGLFFALVSLAAAELLHILVSTTLRDITGGHDGYPAVPRPMVDAVDFYDNTAFFYLILVIVLTCLVMMAVLRASPFGRLCQGVRLNPVRMTHLGFGVAGIRTIILAVSGVFAGIAGGLLASLMMFVSPDILGWTTSGDVLIMALLGGAGTLLGPLLGALVFEVLRDVLSGITVHWYGLLGLGFVLCTMYLPGGLMSLRLSRFLPRGAARKEPELATEGDRE